MIFKEKVTWKALKSQMGVGFGVWNLEALETATIWIRVTRADRKYDASSDALHRCTLEHTHRAQHQRKSEFDFGKQSTILQLLLPDTFPSGSILEQ